EKGFDQVIVYGNETDIEQVIGQAKQYPMFAPKRVVIVKEAQHLSRSIDKIVSYLENPQESTVLVINYKGKKIDKRLKYGKLLSKNKWEFESKAVKDYQLPNFVENLAKTSGLKIDAKSTAMLSEYLGNDLGRVYNEIQKLKIVVKDRNITPEIIEQNIGISKDYNNFELQNAMMWKDAEKAFKISKYFGDNPKNNPMVLTIAVLYNMFSKLIAYHTLTDKSPGNVSKEFGINPFFVKDYQAAAKHYPLKKSTRIISLLRETDVKSKGIGTSGRVSHSELLDELIFKIISL
ncbi:MAG: DNA polymerase III subunit delta, partial [Weeksellaceae bacterium]|nr:DNA polymerase III subunit delta [Weeksellaceae bacterium]